MTLYEELSIPPTASLAEIKAAYRKRAKQTHPDNGGTHEKFNKTNRAYMILSNPARRSKYDATGDTEELLPDNAQAMALNVVVGFFAHVVQQYAMGGGSDPTQVDLVAIAIKQFEMQIGEMLKKKKPMEQAGKVLRDIEKRLKNKKKKSPHDALLRRSLQQQAASIATPIAEIDRTIQAHRDAIELIKHYDFEQAVSMAPDLSKLYASPFYKTSGMT